MNFKHWPYWVGGGVIGLIVFTLFVWSNFQEVFSYFCKMGGPCPSAWENFLSGGYLFIIVYGIPVTALGALLGHLYGKFKNRKSPLAKGVGAF